MDTETIINVVHVCNNLAFGFHVCENVPEKYIWQTAGDAYNCLATNSRINEGTKMIVIAVVNKEPQLVVINDDGSHLDLNIELFFKKYYNDRPTKMDGIKVSHSNFEISKYVLYIDANCTIEMAYCFKVLLNAMCEGKEEYKIYRLESVIWEQLQNDKQE